MTIDRALELNPELKDAYENDRQVKYLVDLSKKIEGMPRHASTHAAGAVSYTHLRIDVLIGTHRILSKDVKFKDLGLLVIDEEQRFGVQHKEAIKYLKKNVDVLTLSATPIPRTLHMSLSGIRSMSTLDEPIEDRYPVQTYVCLLYTSRCV